MKAIIIAGVLCGFALGAAAPELPASAPGRYQLLQAETYYVMKGGGATRSELFRIDTATGRTWVYTAGLTDGKVWRTWASIDDAP